MELYVSDLDGTLLNSDKEISAYSKEILNKTIDKGINFTVATARTPATTVEILEGVNLNIPVAMMNGVLIYDVTKEQYIDIKEVEKETVHKVLNIFKEANREPLLYGIKNNHLYVYHKDFKYESEYNFYKERCNKPLKTFIKVKDYKCHVEDSKIINFIIFDKLDVIEKIYDKLKCISELTTNYYEDIYEKGSYFLETYSSKASKANAIKYLSRYTKHSKVITFGDNFNDIPMFEISDECYALDNAVDSLKRIATDIIGCNNDDAVAKFIDCRVNKEINIQ